MASEQKKYELIAIDEPRELESNSSGDEFIPSSSVDLNVSRRRLGKIAVVFAVVSLVGAVLIISGHRTSQQEAVPEGSRFSEFDKIYQKVGPGSGADPSPDTSSALTLPKLCDRSLVLHVCTELKNAPVDELGVMDIAQALGIGENGALTFLGSLGVAGIHSHITMKCQDLCEKLVDSLAEYRRPPGHDVGGRRGYGGKVIWDIDLSPAALQIIIPEPPTDPEGDKNDTTPYDLPLQRRLGSDDLQQTIEADAADILANLFRIYPIPAYQSAPPAHAPPAPPSANPCGVAPTTTAAPVVNPCARRLKQEDEEAIYGNGEGYVGKQTKTRSGEQCRKWDDKPHNYCRNPDGDETIWCFVEGGGWGYCDPIGAPPLFAEGLEKARIIAKAWLTKTLREFSGAKLPDAYEKWMGPSQTASKKGLTKQGCRCKRRWTSQGQRVTDYCGNPDQDPAGEWCFVRDNQESCQGSHWGYCFPRTTTSRPCGPGCQEVHKKLLATAALLDELTFKYDAEMGGGTFAYIYSWGTEVKKRIPVKRIRTIQSSFREDGKVLFKKSEFSDSIKGRKVIYMCPAWYNMCKSQVTLESCGSGDNFGTTVGTVIHEAMHHVPVGLKDYLYYRQQTSRWVAANKMNHAATEVVKNAADPMEYFVADNNGYTDTSR